MRSLLHLLASVVQLPTAAKAFEEHTLLGSGRLNRWGLHALRVKLAYQFNQRRRARLSSLLCAADRASFDRNGFVVRRDFLPAAAFAALRAQVNGYTTSVQERAEGSTLLRKIPVDERVLQLIPQLRSVLDDPMFRALLAYGEGHRAPPAIYLQSVMQQAASGAADPQCTLHRDTFHPNVKAWLYLTDVPEQAGPLVYVPGSHRLTPQRLAWEKAKSVEATARSKKAASSFRVMDAELVALGCGRPERLAVPANTLVVADTFGFHARGVSDGPSTRVEVWAIGRRSPFLTFRSDRALQKLALRKRRHLWQVREAGAFDRDD
jgi:hypothetical protein